MAEGAKAQQQQQEQQHSGHEHDVLVIGDLHGDLKQGLAALRLVGAIDEVSWMPNSRVCQKIVWQLHGELPVAC